MVQGYGMATFPSTPVTPDTLFYGASTTKAFVATVLSMMIESQNYTVPSPPDASQAGAKLGWRTPISSVIRDDFVLADAWATEHLTFEDALSHRTGMPRHDKALAKSYPGSDGQQRPAAVGDVVRSLRHLPLNAPPRVKFQYCNTLWQVTSHAIETLTGRWLGDVLQEWIWAPLGMGSSYFSLQDALAGPEHFAAGYYWDDAADTFREVPYMDVTETSGAGAVISNVKDYAKWIRALLHEAKPLSKDILEAVKTPRIFTGDDTGTDDEKAYDMPEAYGHGWFTNSYRGHRFWTHSGGSCMAPC